MNDKQLAWLRANRMLIINSQIPVEDIVDVLVSEHVFYTTHDDYQTIKFQATPAGKTRELLDALPSKSQAAFSAFINALERFCPHVLERCVAPRPSKSRFSQLRELLSVAYTSKSTMRPIPRLGAKANVYTPKFSLDLVVVDHEDLAKSMNDRTSTTASEQKRHDLHYARPRTQNTVSFESLFLSPNASRQNTDNVDSHAASAASAFGENVAASVQAVPLATPDVVRCEQEAITGAQPLHAPFCSSKVAVWAGAGCGKTGTCSHVAMLHSRGQLWPFFEALLLWRLREPAVQKATSLAQLLAILLPDVTENELQRFADDILECKGRGILAILDGADELVERDNSYICRLLNGDVLSEACLLATSRPCEAARNFFDSTSSVFDVSVELLGFSENQVDKFIDEDLDADLGPKLKELLDKNPSLASLMSVPLLAVLVCRVFKSTPDLSLSTRSRLYSLLVLLVLRHAVDEKRVALSDVEKVRLKAAKDVRQLPLGVAKQCLMGHAKIAWAAHKKDKAIFDTDFILEEAEWHSLDPLAVGLLDSYYSAAEDLHELRQFCFQHLTFQEFLAAYFLVETTGNECDLETLLTDLCKDNGSHVVLQFLAGLLNKEHHSFFFHHLNLWLHDPHLRNVKVQRERLGVFLQCAHEACVGDVDSFPDQLKLPKCVILHHVTAMDLTTLSAAVKKSSTIDELVLRFDEVGEESKSEKGSRVMRQIRSAMASLITAICHNTSLRVVGVYGPKYKLVEKRSLANLVRNNRLETLGMWDCEVGDEEVSELSSELRQNTKLDYLNLSRNVISDGGMCTLADALAHNTTLHTLYISANQYSEDTAAHLRRQLVHIKDLSM